MAVTGSLVLLIQGRSILIGLSLRGGHIRSIQIRKATVSPFKAIFTAF